ncbi:hypothetical protein EHM76_03310, partial [bacterium]
MNKNLIALTFLATILLLGVVRASRVSAQQPDNGWSTVLQLSTGQGKAHEASLVSDAYGYAHFFWTEELADYSTMIFYTRFDGSSWSPPVDIHNLESFKHVGSLSPVVAQDGTLYLLWTDTTSHLSFLASAPAYNATSARYWSKPIEMNIPANNAVLRIDSKGVFHVTYILIEKEVGVYYMHSEDQGLTWSERIWLDPGIKQEFTPSSLNFDIDNAGGLHVVWNYETFDGIGGDQVCYMHSLDGGLAWSKPKVLDSSTVLSDSLDFASPVMAIQGQTILVIWAAGEVPYRNQIISKDAGQTWTSPARIFGDLQGQAFEGLIVDGNGRFHYFGQVRYPRGIYHAVWDQDQWTAPSLVYLIGDTSDLKNNLGENETSTN